MFFRAKKTGNYTYLQIVENYRDGKAVKQRVLSTLGRFDSLKESGQLDALIRSGSKLCENLAVLDAHETGGTDVVAVRSIGPDLVFGRLWEESGIGPIIRNLLENRYFEFPLERAIYLTVLHRLFSPGSDRAAERWREGYSIPGTESLNLHHLYRAMAWLGESIPDKMDLLGNPRCMKDFIEETLFERRRDLFSEIDLVFFDTTSIYFEGEGGQTLGKRGHSKDFRRHLKQMIVGLALDSQGWPLCCHLWPGNTTDVKTLIPAVKDLRTRFRVSRVSIVADGGMMSKEVVDTLKSCDFQCDYILGVRLRNVKDVYGGVLLDKAPFQQITPERSSSKDPSPLKVKEVIWKNKRYIVCLNEEQRRKDKIDRETIIEKLKDQLKRGDMSLVKNRGFKKYLSHRKGHRFFIDEKKIKADEKFDGIWVLETNTDLETEVVAFAYKQLWMVEDLFRTMKSILETRPIYHKCDENIRGHVFCSFLVLVLRRELERRLESRRTSFEWMEIIRGLDNLHEVEISLRNKKFLLRSRLVGQANDACLAAGVRLPPPVKPIH